MVKLIKIIINLLVLIKSNSCKSFEIKLNKNCIVLIELI